MSPLAPQQYNSVAAVNGDVTSVRPPLAATRSQSVVAQEQKQFEAAMASDKVQSTSSTTLTTTTTQGITPEEQKRRKAQWLAGASLPTVLSGLSREQQTTLCWRWYYDDDISSDVVYKPLRSELEARLFTDGVNALKRKFNADYSQQLETKYGPGALSALQTGTNNQVVAGMADLKRQLDSDRKDMTALLKTDEFQGDFSLGKRRERLLFKVWNEVKVKGTDDFRGLEVLVKRELMFLIQINGMMNNILQNSIKPEIEE